MADRPKATIDLPYPLHAHELEQDLHAAGFDVDRVPFDEQRMEVPSELAAPALLVAGMLLDRATQEAVDAAWEAAKSWIKRRREGSPAREVKLYGPEGEVIRRVRVEDLDAG